MCRALGVPTASASTLPWSQSEFSPLALETASDGQRGLHGVFPVADDRDGRNPDEDGKARNATGNEIHFRQTLQLPQNLEDPSAVQRSKT